MSAVDEIQAAIDKLAAQRGDDAEWWAFEGDPSAIYATTEAVNELHVLDTVEESDRDLIVTLHRTIDPQLAILNEARLQMMSRERLGLPLNTGPVRALALARAINGGTQ